MIYYFYIISFQDKWNTLKENLIRKYIVSHIFVGTFDVFSTLINHVQGFKVY